MSIQLSSWNDGAAKSAIIDFVTKVTTPNGPDFVLPAERVATFDNDGTLWCEKPMYIQLDFVLRRWVENVPFWRREIPTATSRCSSSPTSHRPPRLRLLVLHDDAAQ